MTRFVRMNLKLTISACQYSLRFPFIYFTLFPHLIKVNIVSISVSWLLWTWFTSSLLTMEKLAGTAHLCSFFCVFVLTVYSLSAFLIPYIPNIQSCFCLSQKNWKVISHNLLIIEIPFQIHSSLSSLPREGDARSIACQGVLNRRSEWRQAHVEK